MSNAYGKAGVNLEAGYESVERIKKHIKRTERLGVMGSIGSFGGMFDLSKLNMKEPVLVSGTDGVGTKLMLAFMMDKHDTIGIDLVAMCVNDILAQGAMPLYFLDYIAVGINEPAKIEEIVSGIAEGCVQANCGLIGGETAEMPDMYSDGHYDVAGFTVGAVEKKDMITGENVKEGDVLIGIPSSGIHSNGYSLVRKIILKDNKVDLNSKPSELDDTLGNTLLTPTKIYVNAIKEVLKTSKINGISHVTGGGFDENIPRALKLNQGVEINEGTWPMPAIFPYLAKLGNIEEREMYNIFNMGIGMIIIADESEAESILKSLEVANEKGYIIGKVTNNEGVKLV